MLLLLQTEKEEEHAETQMTQFLKEILKKNQKGRNNKINSSSRDLCVCERRVRSNLLVSEGNEIVFWFLFFF